MGTQYETVRPFLGSLPKWIADEEEQQRIRSYEVYTDIYWNVPATFKLVARGTEDSPIYVPAGRSIVETINRYLCPGVTIISDPSFAGETANDLAVELATQVMTDFVRRERFYTKFNTNKRFGLIRGDSMFFLHADPEREPGSKVSITAIDPGSIFPIYQEDDIDVVIGYDIVTEYQEGDKVVIRRQRYLKTTLLSGPSPISFTDELYEVEDWGGPGTDRFGGKVIRAMSSGVTLPPPIDFLPIYHFPNSVEPGRLWGSSEMRGLERIFAAVNQSISDEELSLALEGLGLYASDAGIPVDDQGEETTWGLGPGRVVNLPKGSTFERVTGVSSVAPYQEHLEYLHRQMDQATGLSDIAKGRVDVSVAESGVALALELAPLLAKAEEKDTITTDVMTNMLYDLAKWFVAYEGGAFNSLIEGQRWIPSYGPRVPRNEEKELAELTGLYQAGLVSAAYVRSRMRSLGYEDMPEESVMANEIIEDKQVSASIQQDAFGARIDGEVQSVLDGTQ